MEILRYLSWAEDEGGMRRGVGIDGKGWRCGGRGKRSHNNDVVLFSHSHTLSLCIITALPVMGATTVTALLKAGLRATTARLYVVMQDVLLTTCKGTRTV